TRSKRDWSSDVCSSDLDLGLEHRGMAHQRRLDLDRRDPDPADLQHVVSAAAVPEVAVLVLIVLVPRLDPRAEQRLLGLLVLVPRSEERRVGNECRSRWM